MSANPTAALVEEALIQDALELCGTRYELEAGYKHRLLSELAHALRRTIAEREEAQRDAESYKRQTQEVSAKAIELTKEVCAKLDHAIAERDELRATVTRLNRRAQTAEAGVRDNVEACKAAGVSMGRTLANAAADMYLRRAEQAEAERDAQHAEVLRLTEERDEARLRLKASEEGLRVVTMERDHAQQVEAPDAFWQRDEARAQVWGLICAGSNMDDHFQKLWESLLAKTREHFAQFTELTATRDLLNEENARLQKERDAAAASLNALAKGARHVPCFGECASERICIACYGLQNLKGWVEWQKRTETERDEARSELAEARAHIATLELLRRGGK